MEQTAWTRGESRDRLARAERWLSVVHKAAVTALALASLWLILG